MIPATRDRRVVIIGAGPGGLCLGAKLRAAGHRDFVILERSDGVGLDGTLSRVVHRGDTRAAPYIYVLCAPAWH